MTPYVPRYIQTNGVDVPVVSKILWSTLPLVSLLLFKAVGALLMLPHWRMGDDEVVVNLKPDNLNGLSGAPTEGEYAIPGVAVVVIIVFSEPEPIKYMPLLIVSVDVHVALPEATFIVSPTVARDKHELTEA
jgi:hypothetical protein